MARTIEFSCPECAKTIVVGTMLAGHEVRCPHCRHSVVAPAATDVRESASGESPDAAGPRRRPGAPDDAVSADVGKSRPELGDDREAETKQPEVLEWYLRIPEGTDFGPVTRSQLETWVAEGRVDGRCRLRCGETAPWRQAVEEFPAVAEVVRFAPPANVVERIEPREEESAGGWVLVLAILGWVTLCPLLPIWAWLWALSDLHGMNNGTRSQDRRAWTVAGMRLAVVEMALMAIAAITLGLLLASLAFG